MGIKIITDSTAYLSEEMINKYDISVVSLNITLNDESIREVDITNEEFYKMMDEAKEFPKSSQPSLDETTKVFEKHLSNGDDIVGIFLSSKMSGTFSSTHIIKEMLLENYPNRKIELIDSESNCMQMGIAVLAAAEKALNGESLENVIAACEKVKETSRFLFMPQTLDYLKMGGRIGTAGALFGKMLKIIPILTVANGETSVVEKVRTKNKAIEKILSVVVDDIKEKGLGKVVVHHINCEDEGKKLAEKISSHINEEVEVVPIGPVIGVHVGPGAIGIAYNTER